MITKSTGIMRPWSVAMRLSLALVISAAALAFQSQAEEGSTAVSWEAEVNASYIGRSNLRGGGSHGSLDAFEVGTRDVASIKAREGFLVRLGLDLQRESFGISGEADLPNTLQRTSLVLGADFQLGEAWLLRFEIEPGFYSSGWSFDGRDFNAPIILGGSYFVSADLQLIAGISIDVNRKYPVLGGVGFRWKISKDWVANFILPAPRLEYSLSKSLTFYAGADFRGDTYRVHGDLGSGHRDRRLGGTVVDYTQIRVGGGLFWKLNSNFSLEVEGGVVPVHELDYYRADQRIRSSGSPGYGAISLKSAF